ncbi:MAG: PfkB family carbohydrate kinase [Oscillospiraceae bacterium]|nr:PfkB family carbohydrate kinase [Oscillospiraceae bacterium]
MDYVVNGSIFINDILEADGTQRKGLPGGAGLFAFGGILLYTGSCVCVSGRGTDWEKWFGAWSRANRICEDGLVPYDNITIVSALEYSPDGTWVECMSNGPREEQREAFEEDCRAMLRRQLLQGAKGLYAVQPLDDAKFWDAVFDSGREAKFTTMMELFTQDCRPENLERLVGGFFPHIGIFSLNRSESFELFSADSEEAVIQKLRQLGKPCYYRVGKKGAYMVTKDEVVFCPSVNPFPGRPEIDPTGCGNCSTAAALYAFAEGYAAADIAAMAAVAAGYNVLQYGPYPRFDAQTRAEALAMAGRLAKTLGPARN